MSNYHRLNFDKLNFSKEVITYEDAIAHEDAILGGFQEETEASMNATVASQLSQGYKKKWNRFPDVVPPEISESEDFGVDYEVKYRLPNGQIETTITEWLWEKEWNCIYPVVAWREENKIVEFSYNNIEYCDDVENDK